MTRKGVTRRQFGLGMAAGVAASGSAAAQQTTGVPGAPDATTTIDGRYIPPPPQKFGGEIKLNAAQSKPFWPPRVVPPKGAPNVLLIMTDDVGFGAPSTFGGVIPTPALDRIANAGPALHAVPLHRAVLADARGADHRAQPSLGRASASISEHGHRLPRLRQHHRPRTRRPSAGSSRTTATPPRGSARTTTRRPSRRARSGRSTSGRSAWASSTSTASSAATPASGSRTCSATRRPIYPYVGNPELEPDHGHGGRRHRAHEDAQRDRPRASRSSSTTCPAARMRRTTRRRSGSRRSATCTCSTRAGTSCASRSSPTRRSSA